LMGSRPLRIPRSPCFSNVPATTDIYTLSLHHALPIFCPRPRDIATYVGSGTLDVGITGRDLLLDSESAAAETAVLGFARSTFRFAGPVGAFAELEDMAGLRVATSYPGLVGTFLRDAGVDVTLVRLDGAVETAIQLGVADVIADVVETGTTLRKAGLEIFGPVILESEAVLVSSPDDKQDDTVRQGASVLLRRLQGVLVARQFVLVDYDVPLTLLDAAIELTPGIESPTISPLRDPEWVAVRAMVPRADTNHIMDALYEVGARAILVSAIHAARI